MFRGTSLFIFLLIGYLSGVAQVHDVGGWVGLSAKFRIKKRVDLVVSHQFRTNSSRVDQVFIEPELRYRMKKGIRWAIAYRPSLKFDLDGGAYLRHRYHIQAQYALGFGDWEIETRVRFQQRFVPIRGAERLTRSNQPMAIRNKWTVNYSAFKKLKPFLQFEYFLGLSGRMPIQLSTLRYKGGVKLDLPKKFDLSIYYMTEQEMTEQQPTYYHVLGIIVSRGFSWKK